METALREQKQRHQTEMIALQEEFARRPATTAPSDVSDKELLERWRGCEDDEAREDCFRSAARKAEAEAEKAREAADSLERLQRDLESLRREDKERAAAAKKIEVLLAEQTNDNASLGKTLSEKEANLEELAASIENLNAKVSSHADTICGLEGSLAEKTRDLDSVKEKLTDEVARTEELARESAQLEVLCGELKSQRDLLKSENERNGEAMEDMQRSFVTLKDGLQGLEDTLEEQRERNRELQGALDESRGLNERLGAELREMRESGGEHEETLAKMKAQIEGMQESDAQMQAFREGDNSILGPVSRPFGAKTGGPIKEGIFHHRLGQFWKVIQSARICTFQIWHLRPVLEQYRGNFSGNKY